MNRGNLTISRNTLTAPHGTLISARSALVASRVTGTLTNYTLTASMGAYTLSGQNVGLTSGTLSVVTFSADETTVTTHWNNTTRTFLRPITVPWNFTPTSGVTRWVAANGSDSNPGTSGSPYLTIQHAYDVANAGDLINVRAGTYQEALFLGKTGTQSNPIILSCAPGDLGKVTVMLPASAYTAGSDSGVIRVQNTDVGVWLNGLCVEGAMGKAGAVYDSDYNQDGITFVGGAGPGCKITNCATYNAFHCGIKEAGHGGTDGLIQGCISFQNGADSLDHGTYLPSNGWTVDGNIFHGNAGYAVHCFNTPQNHIVTRNIGVYNGYGIVLGGAGITVSNNVFAYNLNDGITWYNAGCNNNLVRDNIFAFNNADSQAWTPGTGNTDDYNCYYPGTPNVALIGQTGTHNVLANPLFVDAANNDFRVQAGSPCLGAGTDVGYGIDIGAYQNSPNSLTAVATAPLEVRLNWSHSNPTADTRYEIERSDGASGWYRIGTAFPGRLQYSDWGRAKSTSYTYRVRATNSIGSSSYTNTASTTTLATDGVLEFVGPFSSWKNVKTDYGAVGNGVADDTAAIQAALDDLKTHTVSCVLYFPAGTYKVTGTLSAIPGPDGVGGWVSTEYQGVSLIGADPATTTIRWAGATDSTILNWNAWYCKVSRLTFDGVSKANNITGMHWGPRFSTYDEISDCRFLDCGIGLQFGDGGDNNYKGQAEKAVQRCYFLRCGEGVRPHDFNTLDIWVWHCHFEDCDYGVRERQGNFHVYRNVFERSTIADCSSRNLEIFSVIGNVSKDSVMFFDWDRQGETTPTSLCNNRIIDATGTFAIALRTAGPFLMADNIIRHKSGATNVVKLSDNADHLLIGNCYDMSNAVTEDTEHVNDPSLCHPRFQYVDEEIISTAAIDPTLPTLPQTSASFGRTIYEVAVGASASTIQTAINNAVATGNRAVVHLPSGNYNLTSTLNIPANANIQIVGDGASEVATRLNWTGSAGGTMITVQKPNYSIFRDFFLHSDTADAMLIHIDDVVGGDLNANILMTQGENIKASVCWWVDGIENADVTSLCHQGGIADAWIKVSGGTQQTAGSTSVPGQVAVFCGATGTCTTQYVVENGGQLVVRTIYHERSDVDPQPVNLAGRGRLAIDCNRFSHTTDTDFPSITTNGFQGDLLISTGKLQPVPDSPADPPTIKLTGDGSALRELIALQAFHTDAGTEISSNLWFNTTSPVAQAGFIGNWGNSPNGQYLWQLANAGTVTDAFIRAMYAPLRAFRIPLPRLATSGPGSIMLHRIMISTGVDVIAVRITT